MHFTTSSKREANITIFYCKIICNDFYKIREKDAILESLNKKTWVKSVRMLAFQSGYIIAKFSHDNETEY